MEIVFTKERVVCMSQKKITVCSECLRASCWQGIFYCENYKNGGDMEVPINELEEWKLEDSSYWCK